MWKGTWGGKDDGRGIRQPTQSVRSFGVFEETTLYRAADIWNRCIRIDVQVFCAATEEAWEGAHSELSIKSQKSIQAVLSKSKDGVPTSLSRGTKGNHLIQTSLVVPKQMSLVKHGNIFSPFSKRIAIRSKAWKRHPTVKNQPWVNNLCIVLVIR